MTDAIWWYGLFWLSATSIVGTLWLIDRGLEWFLDGFKFRAAFFRWYADYLREKRSQ